MTMTAGGWLFMITAWVVIGGGAVWCMAKLIGRPFQRDDDRK
jgi:hypothetical protein